MIKDSGMTLVDACQGKSSREIPFWFMRQAGRYLPEYRELRSRAKNFLNFCYTPEMASEATLQPIRRFGMSGAIIFSDILVVPDAMGVKVWFEEGHGPRLEPVKTSAELKALKGEGVEKKLAPVYEALKLTRAALPKDTALIGFIGAPWTLACYVVEGSGTKTFDSARAAMKQDEVFFMMLIKQLADAAATHAINQIDAGANIIQIFDSWAGLLDESDYARWVVAPTREIVKTIKAKHPHTPVIGFPRQSGTKFLNYVEETGVDAISFDHSAPLHWVAEHLQPRCVVQGCLDPVLLADDRDAMLKEARAIIDMLADKPFVFNLGHGILPHTPVEHMQALCDFLKTRTL
jgi:uroporphyrinogen decarboxylase